jgi:hypothetical protein
MTKMTSQLAQQGLDMGAIYEIRAMYRYQRPHTAYALTAGMMEHAVHTDYTYLNVLVAETGEVMPTRRFKAEVWPAIKKQGVAARRPRHITGGAFDSVDCGKIRYHLVLTIDNVLKLRVSYKKSLSGKSEEIMYIEKVNASSLDYIQIKNLIDDLRPIFDILTYKNKSWATYNLKEILKKWLTNN